MRLARLWSSLAEGHLGASSVTPVCSFLWGHTVSTQPARSWEPSAGSRHKIKSSFAESCQLSHVVDPLAFLSPILRVPGPTSPRAGGAVRFLSC